MNDDDDDIVHPLPTGRAGPLITVVGDCPVSVRLNVYHYVYVYMVVRILTYITFDAASQNIAFTFR